VSVFALIGLAVAVVALGVAVYVLVRVSMAAARARRLRVVDPFVPGPVDVDLEAAASRIRRVQSPRAGWR